MKRPLKIANVLVKVNECIHSGRYYDTSHAIKRKNERKITVTEVLYVLRNGYHEKRKDEYKPEYDDWTYAIRGLTIDRKDVRIAIAFDEHEMLIITVIEIK